MTRFVFRSVLSAACVAYAPVDAQRPIPTIMLDKGAKEITEPFTHANSMVELPDGRMLVSDIQQKELWLVDFRQDSRRQAARTGAGPTEFQMGVLLAGASDSAVFYDVQQRRFLLFSPAGTPSHTLVIAAGRGDPMAAFSAMQPRAVDAAGHVFGQTMGMKMPSPEALARGGGGDMPMPTFADTVTIERLDPRTGRTDTIARVRNPALAGSPEMGMSGGVMKLTMRAPDHRSGDDWAVLPDGRVALLRDGIYRVHFVTPGKPAILGPPVPHTLISIGADERKATIDSTRAMMTRMQSGAAGPAGMTMPKIEIEVLSPLSWPATKGPYIAIAASPDRRLWVRTPLPFNEKGAAYDVLDDAGALIAHVRTAPGETIVAYGRGAVFTTRIDTDDLVYLRRYALPAPLGTGK